MWIKVFFIRLDKEYLINMSYTFHKNGKFEINGYNKFLNIATAIGY